MLQEVKESGNLSHTDNENYSFKELVFKFKEWYDYFKSKFKIVLISCVIGGSIGLAFGYLEKPKYKALLTFAMEDDKGTGNGLSGALGLASSIGIDLGGTGGGAFAASNLTELIRSRLIVEKVLLNSIDLNNVKTTLADYYIKINGLEEACNKNPGLKNINYSSKLNRTELNLQQDSLLEVIYKSLIDKDNLSIVQKDKKVSILTIEVFSNDEKFSKLFCENLAKLTSEFYIETKSKKAKMNVDILQKQSDSVKNELNSSITGVAAAADNVFNLNQAFNIKSAMSKKKQIDVQTNTAVLTQIIVQLELAKITLRKETPLIQLIDTPIYPLEKIKFGKLKLLIFGCFIAGFISMLYFTIIKLFNELMK